jgi:serine/threonine protein kinase
MKDRLTPVLIDFGLAMAWKRMVRGEFTRTGEILGSPSYMAPSGFWGGQSTTEATSVLLALCFTKC